MIYQANVSGIMESDNMSPTYFWKIFGKVSASHDLRKFIETDEEVPVGLQGSLVTIFNSDTLPGNADDTIIAGKKARRLHGALRTLEQKIDLTNKKTGWVRLWADVYCWDGEVLNNTWMVVKARNDKSEVKRKWYRIGRIEDGNEWKTLSIDMHLTAGKATDLYAGVEQSQAARYLFMLAICVLNIRLRISKPLYCCCLPPVNCW